MERETRILDKTRKDDSRVSGLSFWHWIPMKSDVFLCSIRFGGGHGASDTDNQSDEAT